MVPAHKLCNLFVMFYDHCNRLYIRTANRRRVYFDDKHKCEWSTFVTKTKSVHQLVFKQGFSLQINE